MPEIRNVQIGEIRDINIPPVRSIFTGLPEPVINNTAPLTSGLSLPIIDMPGCVETHPDGPGLIDNDSSRVMTLCDGQVPSFNPINYNPEQLIYTGPPEPIKGVKTKPPEAPESVEVPYTPMLPKLDTPEISTPKEEKKEEVIEVEEPGFVEKYLPTAEEVTTTVTIATAAAAAAVFGKPIAELILRLIKPAVKQVLNKVQRKFGKKNILSTAERRQLQKDLRKG
jgi:hypothetical protein